MARNKKEENGGVNVATWHNGEGLPGEMSDVFVWMEHMEGSDTDMPEDVWEKLCELTGGNFTGVLWIDFLD